jgi:subtilisin family serine protease
MELSRAEVRKQRAEIAAVQRRVRDHLRGTSHAIRREFGIVPYVALEIDAIGLARLEAAGLDVESIYQDRLAKPFLAESIPQIEGDLALQVGLDGTGSVVVIADTGVDKDHPFLAGKVIEEACYALSDNGIDGDCPNGEPTQVTDGAGVPCTFAPSTCRHGTHVAGIAVGSGINFSGVAPGADLIAIQVFHSSLNCGAFEGTPCARAFASDIVAALERAYELRDQYPIASVNLSLGAGATDSTCDADFPEFLAIMDNLKAAGIATVVASGNGAYNNAISWPACISSAVSVAAVDENDLVASFSNVSQDLDFFAPGTAIDSSVPGGDFATFSGTSMSTPHVAGAWAVLEQANPAATVDDNLTLLETTGRPVTDIRGLPNITKPRIRLAGAAGIEYPLPILTSIAPTSVSAWGPETTLTITGLDFARSSVVFVDGVAVPTVYVSDTVLTTTLTANDLATSATSLDISVFSPPPGGGTSTSITLNVVQPSLTVSSTSASPGDLVSVTLSGGPGGTLDWLALAEIGDPDMVYSQWTYIGAGLSSFTWTVTMPATVGLHEFRLFSNAGFIRIATSPTVMVQTPAPSIESISPTKVTAFGPNVVLTVTGADFFPTSEIQVNGVTRATSYVTSTVLKATLPASDLATAAASIDITVFTPPPGGGSSNAVPLVLAHPTLTVSSSSVAPGEPITVTLNDGPGGDVDWLALAGTGDPDTTYLQWIYVIPGATTATWTVTMPTSDGNYEFRLFENGGFTRIATSSTVTVGSAPTEPPPEPPPDPPPPQPAALDVSATAVNGGDTVTVSLSGGPGNSYDWLALAGTGDPDTTYLQWIYVSPGATTATWTVTMGHDLSAMDIRQFGSDIGHLDGNHAGHARRL